MLSSFNVHSCVYIKNIFIPDFCFLDEYISKKIDTTQRLIQNKKLSKLSMRRKFGFDKMIEKVIDETHIKVVDIITHNIWKFNQLK